IGRYNNRETGSSSKKEHRKKDSSEIWSDKVSLLHIKGTQRGGEHGGESRQPHGGAEGTKSDRGVVCVLLITLVINVLRNLTNHYFGKK
ncbi:hypothetical protein, partial [Prevotella pallens]|uniref:hypothetical protein n=1 Tax=Prevotella pallens TaxID=60133 RepID=UPI001CAB42AD